jgi:hypothetical protein
VVAAASVVRAAERVARLIYRLWFVGLRIVSSASLAPRRRRGSVEQPRVSRYELSPLLVGFTPEVFDAALDLTEPYDAQS